MSKFQQHSKALLWYAVADKIFLKFRADFLNAIYFRQGLIYSLGLTNDSIDSGQPRAKPHLRKVKPHHVLKTIFSPQFNSQCV